MSYQQTIYNMLRRAGMTEAGALGVLGNWEWESGCEPNRKENDNAASRIVSKNYTERIMNGSITKAQFATGKPGTGYGLAQWTYQPRQAELYDFWKAYGGRIDNLTMQVEFALKEFKRDFIADWRLLCSTSSIDEAAKAVCDRFENPKVKNYDTRIRLAYRIKGEIDLGHWENTEVVIPSNPEKPQQSWEQIPATEFWPPRTLCKGMKGADVVAVRGLLFARGWFGDNSKITNFKTAVGDEDEFDDGMKEKVLAFQKAVFPDDEREWDGIVGEKTFGELVRR